MDFVSNIETISEEQLNSLFNSSEVVLPAPTEKSPTVEPVETKNPDLTKKQSKPVESGIPLIDDLDNFLSEETEEKVEEKKSEEKVEEKKPEEEEKKVEENKDPEEETEEKEEDQVDTTQINSVLKSTVDYLVEKGLFSDFEGRDKLEVTDEVYADIVQKQLEEKLSDMFSEVLDSTGDYGKAIINHIRQGGNPDDILDLFKEQKKIENFDISDKRGQLSLIKKYYSEVVGWKDSKIDNYVSTLEGSESGLEDEAKEIQAKYDEIHQEQLESIKKQQEEIEKEQKKLIAERKKQQQEYLNSLMSAIDSSESFDNKDKKLIKESVIKFNKKLDDGTPVNGFFHKFYQMQKDPKLYAQLIHFVMDKEGYDKKIQLQQKNKDTKNVWTFVKQNSSVNKRKPESDIPAGGKSSKGFDFSSVLQRK